MPFASSRRRLTSIYTGPTTTSVLLLDHLGEGAAEEAEEDRADDENSRTYAIDVKEPGAVGCLVRENAGAGQVDDLQQRVETKEFKSIRNFRGRIHHRAGEQQRGREKGG